jgi:signal transduction histidine kinase/CheY-like chemotaxis protein
MSNNRNTIKTKVIGWFLLAALAVLLTGIISYNSYRELIRSLENPVSQEAKLKELGNILADITEAEAKMRTYALTREAYQLDTYQQLVETIKQDLELIKVLDPVSPEFNIGVDSVSLLIDQQISGVGSFIELKNTINEVSFSAKALAEINNSSDSIPALRTTTTTTTKTTTVEPLPPSDSDDKKRKNTKRQQKKRTQEIARELAKLEKEPLIQTETVITTDTSYVQPDTTYSNIQQVLVDLDKEESHYQQVLANKELLLIESSIGIIDQIRALIQRLEKQELSYNIERTNKAKLIASKSTLTISIIIFACLVLGILFTYLIFKDVRISDYYNRQLIGARDQAESLAESKQQFLANMSHEIRTPLNAIIGFTEQLSKTPLKTDQSKYLEALQTSGQQLLHTVNDILDFSKLEVGELKIASERFDLKRALQEVITVLRLKADEKGLKLTLQTDPEGPIWLIGDQFRLKQVLFNLINNGIKFTEKGYVAVDCTCKMEPDIVRVELSVLDSGIGIPEEERNEIFIDFKQVDPSATRRYQGTGLGLAICKRLVELQGGSITVDSNEPIGAKFILRLDYKLAEIQAQDIITSDENNLNQAIAGNSFPSLKGVKLLVADDDNFNIQLIRTILDNWKADVVYCSDGKQAYEEIGLHDFDLILTDINMPEMSGVELSQKIRSLSDPEKNTVPIIALTANIMEDDLEKYKEAGINDFVLKPFKEADLHKKVMQHIPTDNIVPDNQSIQYRLDDFKKFSVGDKEALRPILEAFYHNLKQNLNALEENAVSSNQEAVAEIAHKMISSFGHVHASGPVDKLRHLENSTRSKDPDLELTKLVNEIQKLSKPILEGLEKEIAQLL